MELFKIGTLADWFGVGLLDGIRASQQVGATGVQVYAWNELDPANVTRDKLRDVKTVAADCGQTITALCGELGGHGLCVPADNPAKLDYLKRTLELAAELDCNIVTTHLGVVPEDKSHPTYGVLVAACAEIGAFAAGMNATIAVETGPEPLTTLCGLIDDCGGKGLSVNYDPANLVMVLREDEVQGVYTAGKHIVHTHAKDGVNLKPTTAEVHYNAFAEGGIEASRALGTCRETPLGEGSVRWVEYLTALKEVGYRGYLTIEREVAGDTTRDDIAGGVQFLREMMRHLD